MVQVYLKCFCVCLCRVKVQFLLNKKDDWKWNRTRLPMFAPQISTTIASKDIFEDITTQQPVKAFARNQNTVICANIKQKLRIKPKKRTIHFDSIFLDLMNRSWSNKLLINYHHWNQITKDFAWVNKIIWEVLMALPLSGTRLQYSALQHVSPSLSISSDCCSAEFSRFHYIRQ